MVIEAVWIGGTYGRQGGLWASIVSQTAKANHPGMPRARLWPDKVCASIFLSAEHQPMGMWNGV